ncbi:zinc ribbon domain-containing protein [Peptoniphilus catoniae]|uniref:zinc ribbon domain-containing protein n=1 Tax=Peptoniphilus catoniae TaxID=1660341 RepID=UPI0010FD6D98|nr:hypothetical protein [Peptoniphilus catoniae]
MYNNSSLQNNSMKRCEKCGGFSKIDANFCRHCGNKFSNNERNYYTIPKQKEIAKRNESLIKKILKIIIYILGILFLLLILATFILQRLSKDNEEINNNQNSEISHY